MSDEFRTYLFNYRFDGAEWGFDIKARSPAEAKERVKALALARYDGELMMRIPAEIGWFARLSVAVRNWWKG